MESSAACQRIIDANLNRLKEALRVIEDVVRFSYNDKEISQELKILRNSVGFLSKQYIESMQFRDTANDVLISVTSENERERESLFSVAIANFKRAQESLRVLEEVFKVIEAEKSLTFKQFRYQTYILEKHFYDRYQQH